MVKPVKALKKQAEKAEAVASRSVDPEHAESMRRLADAFRAQAQVMKETKKAKKIESKK